MQNCIGSPAKHIRITSDEMIDYSDLNSPSLSPILQTFSTFILPITSFMKNRVTGIGGIFFKADDPRHLQNWYDKHLGLQFEGKGHSPFFWKEKETGKEARTEFSFFPRDTGYLAPSSSPFMINFRVENLEALLSALKAEGVQQVGEMESYPYGKFAWILDPEGNKIELWEPLEQGFDDKA